LATIPSVPVSRKTSRIRATACGRKSEKPVAFRSASTLASFSVSFPRCLCLDPVRVQREGPLGGFDRLDDGLLDQLIVTGSEGVCLEFLNLNDESSERP